MPAWRIGPACYAHCASSTILTFSRTLVGSKTPVTRSKPRPGQVLARS